MKNFTYNLNQLKKGTKFLAIIFITVLSISIAIQSCNSGDEIDIKSLENSKNFIKTASSLGKKMSNITATTPNAYNGNNRMQRSITNYESIYLQYDNSLSELSATQMTNNVKSLLDLSNIITNNHASIHYDPHLANPNYKINIPLQSIINNLKPLIQESRNYLHTKGFTDREIDEMIINEGGKEEDLIPFVMILTDIENNNSFTSKKNSLTLPFINMAYAQVDGYDFIKCGIVAIGADALWALGTSKSSKWKKTAMKKAFRAVASKFLGPFGVAIAVVTFGVCMTESYYD